MYALTQAIISYTSHASIAYRKQVGGHNELANAGTLKGCKLNSLTYRGPPGLKPADWPKRQPFHYTEAQVSVANEATIEKNDSSTSVI